MMPSASKQNVRTIIVAGDVTIDWTIARARAHLGKITPYQYIWGSDIATRACSQSGGAALLTKLLNALCETKIGFSNYEYRVIGPTIPSETLNNLSQNKYLLSYSIWSAYPRRIGEKKMVWRAVEFWGTDYGTKTGTIPAPEDSPQNAWGLVLDDADLGTRDQQETWPVSLKNPSAETEWVLVKISHPIAQGPLWEQLITYFPDKLIVVVSVNDLRKAKMHIGYELSWEQISDEVIHAVSSNSDLSKPSAVIVVLGTTGAIIIDRKKGNSLIFDPYAQEKNWRRDHPGTCIGYTSCYISALVSQFIQNSGKPDLKDAIKRGVTAARTLHLTGYAEGDGRTLVNLQFPIKAVTEALKTDDVSFASVSLQNLKKEWTIFSIRQNLNIKKIAADIVKLGPKVSLRDIPLEQIGGWSSIDRTEIENINSLGNIMTEYAIQSSPSRPLSVAVFGPPGSGKSFAVKEVAKGLMPGKLSHLEFNLSQFESHEELAAVFHLVRDCTLRHELPLVFWDEFDTPLQDRELGWLRYFLVPMQDGEFHEGGTFHPLGPAIFVFAGGTCSTMESFRERTELNLAAKGGDFISRLRGFLNILGPNQQGEHDEGFILRRALLLRSLLMRKAEQLFDTREVLHIDEGVLQALLLIDFYRHGARSMECIIDMSSLSGKLMFERSCLPALNQLDLHVDAGQFFFLVSGPADDK